MNSITCFDSDGNPHSVPATKLVKRISAYGIFIKDDTVLLVYEKRAKRWDFPGGGVEQGEDVVVGLQREFAEETGLNISSNVTLMEQRKEYYYSLGNNEGWDSKRHFFLVKGMVSGTLLRDGNGEDTAAAEFVTFEEANARLTRDMYKDLLSKAILLVK